MGFLIAVLTCHKFRARADVLRETWVKDVEGATVKFFLGGGEAQREDEVILDCPDDYPSFRIKVQRMFAWAVERDYDYVFKTDDDVYIIPDRLIREVVRTNYQGRVRGPSQENDAPRIYGPNESSFCSGFGYWLSKDAARLIGQAPDNQDWAEDRFVGNILFQHGIRPWNNPNILLWPPLTGHYCHVPNGSCGFCISQYVNASVVCPYARPDVIPALHKYYKETAFIPTWIPE